MNDLTEDEQLDNLDHDFWYHFRSQIGWSERRPFITIYEGSKHMRTGAHFGIRFLPKELGSGNFFIQIQHSPNYSRQQLVVFLSQSGDILISRQALDAVVTGDGCVDLDAHYVLRN